MSIVSTFFLSLNDNEEILRDALKESLFLWRGDGMEGSPAQAKLADGLIVESSSKVREIPKVRKSERNQQN